MARVRDITCSAAQFHAEGLLKGPAWNSDQGKKEGEESMTFSVS